MIYKITWWYLIFNVFSDSRNKYRNQNFNTKPKLPSSSSLLDNHIIITPTSTNNLKTNEIKIPRFGNLKDNMKSLPRSDMSEKGKKTPTNIDQHYDNTTWDNRSFKKQPKQRANTTWNFENIYKDN